jgi:type I restriction enzyme R subunit
MKSTIRLSLARLPRLARISRRTSSINVALDDINDKASIIDTFFSFAQAEQKREAEELIRSESLNEDAAKRYITSSINVALLLFILL